MYAQLITKASEQKLSRLMSRRSMTACMHRSEILSESYFGEQKTINWRNSTRQHNTNHVECEESKKTYQTSQARRHWKEIYYLLVEALFVLCSTKTFEMLAKKNCGREIVCKSIKNEKWWKPNEGNNERRRVFRTTRGNVPLSFHVPGVTWIEINSIFIIPFSIYIHRSHFVLD